MHYIGISPQSLLPSIPVISSLLKINNTDWICFTKNQRDQWQKLNAEAVAVSSRGQFGLLKVRSLQQYPYILGLWVQIFGLRNVQQRLDTRLTTTVMKMAFLSVLENILTTLQFLEDWSEQLKWIVLNVAILLCVLNN